MTTNRGVVYLGQVEVPSIDYPKLQSPAGKKLDHAVILKIVPTIFADRPSTWSAAGTAVKARPAFASTRIRRGRERPTVMWIWAAGSAARRNK